MDVTNGRIYQETELEKIFGDNTAEQFEKLRKRIKLMNYTPTQKQMQRKPPRIGHNDVCPCGSGKKFKHYCLRDKHDERFS